MKKLLFTAISAVLVIIVSFAVFAEPSKDDTASGTETTQSASLPQAENLAVVKKLSGNLTLSWSPVEGAHAYKVYVKDTKDEKYRHYLTVKKTQLTFDGIFSDSVKFKIKALRYEDDAVIPGETSEAVGVLPRPEGVGALYTRNITNDSITLYWNKAEGATGYRLYIYDEKQDKFVIYTRTPRTTATVSGLEKDTLYTFKVLSYNKSGGSISYGTYSDEYKEYTYNSGAVPHTKAQTAQYYNNHIAKLKSQQNMAIKYKKSIDTEFISCSRKNLAVSVKNTLNLFEGTLSKTYRYAGGKSEDKSANKLIEPYGKVASLERDDIKEYSAEKKGDSIIVRITLKSENKIYNKGAKAGKSYYDGVLSLPEYKKLKTAPLSIESADSYYNGGNLTLKITDRKISVFKVGAAVLSDITFTVADVKATTLIGYEMNERYEINYDV